jgi:hypothetical protein
MMLFSVICLALMVPTAPAFLVQPSPTLTKRTHSDIVVLRMNLFDRFTRVAKANLNNVLKNLEDPEKIMSQALEDMQVSSSESRQDESMHKSFASTREYLMS